METELIPHAPNDDAILSLILEELADRSVVPANLTKELNIDPGNLEKELLLQPYLYAGYALLHADAVSAYDDAKAELDLKVAELDGIVRTELLDAGMKVTDKATENAVKCHEDYTTALWAKQRAYHHMLICEGIRRAFEQRMSALTMIASSRNAVLKGTP